MRKLLTLLAFLLIFLTACNQTAEIKITFIENGGVELEDLTIKTTDTSVTLPTPVRDGYTFDGWFTDEDLTLPFTIAALLTQSGGITLYAKWTQVLNQFTVTYQTNGGSTIAPVTYTSGETIVEPTAPTKEGYTFNGWYGDSELTQSYTFGPMPDSNLTLYAKWTINQYTITFESNGGSTVTALTGDYQTLITKPTNPIKVGYTFVDWYLEPAFTTPYVFNTMGSSNITLYAKWQINTYTVTFESNQGSAVPAILTEYNTAITQPNDPTKIGHTFGGWYSDQTMTVPFVFTTLITQDLTLYAKWNVNSYTMTFNSMGGSPINPVTQPYGSQITVPNPAKEGYDFAGWYTSDTYTTLYTVTTMPDGSMTVYAKWTASPYTITFDSNGGTAVTAITANYSDVVTKPENPTKMGHTFVDWYSDSALTTAFVFNTMPVGGATLFAKWTVNEYTITFVVSGGTEITPMVAGYDTVITAPTTTKPGYVFQGWYTEAELNNAYTFDKMGASDMTLYAKWQPLQYSIQFMSNGGSNVDTIYGILDETITKPEDPTKQGYTFGGWYTESVFTTLFVWDKMPLDGVTLYAKWTINTYTLTYIIEGSLINQEIAYQSEITFAPTPEVEGYTFVGWLENSEPFTLTLMPDRDVTILPKYEVNYYTISFGNITKDPMSVKYADPIAIVEPTPPMGYAFTGWYVDEFFLTEFEGTHMPAEDVVLFAQFEALAVSLYLHVDELEVNTLLIGYGDVYKPNEPFKEGYQFLGWYLEDTYMTRVYDVEMGLDPIHLYAKWQIDEGYDLIETILMTQPSETVTVKGIISYIFERPGFPGFYLYDGTSNIFVLANPAPFVVGDIVEFNATYDNFENTPQLINPSGMVIATGIYVLPGLTALTYDDVMRLDETNPMVYGQRIQLEAYLGYAMGGFYLQAPFSDDKIMINYRSIIDDGVIMPFINQTVIIEAYIHDFQSMAGLWHIAYIPNSMHVPTYTPQDIIDQVIELGTSQLEGRVFYPGAMLQLPNGDPTYGTTLQWSVIGDHAAYFDLQTFTFQATDTERTIELQCIISLEGFSETVVFNLILRPVTFLTYDQLLALDNDTYAMIKGVVLAHIPLISGTIITLDGRPVYVSNNHVLNPGDEVVFVGYKRTEMGMVMLQNNPDESMIEVTQTGLPLPTPTEIPLSVFVNLPGDNPLYWFKYVKLTGTLQFDPNSGYYFLTDGPDATGILTMTHEANSALGMYLGMPVTLTGFTLMNFDVGGRLHFVFLNGPTDIEPIELTTEEKIECIYFQLMGQFVHTFYHPGDTIVFPITDKLFGAAIAWNPVNDSASYVNLTTGYVNDQINQFITVELEVVISLDGVSSIYTLFIHIQPSLMQVDIMTLQNTPITEVMMQVIVIVPPQNNMAIVGDSTGFMALYTNRQDLLVGDLIEIQGHRMSSSENIFVNQQGETVVNLLMREMPDPTWLTPITLFDLQHLPYMVLAYQYRRYEVSGTLYYSAMSDSYHLTNSNGDIVIITPYSESASLALYEHINQDIIIRGYAILSEVQNELLFVNQPNDLYIPMSDEMILASIVEDLQSMYDKTYRPGQQVMLEPTTIPYFPEINYVLLSDPSLYNMDFYTVGHVTEPTYISFEVTILYNGLTQVFTLELYVEPIVLTDIQTILAAPLGESFYLEAVVLFRSYDENTTRLIVGDATGYIVILGKHFYYQNDLLQLYGYTQAFEGGIGLMVEAYNVTLLQENATPMTMPIPMSLYQAMQVNELSPAIQYIVISGTVKRDNNVLSLYDEVSQEEVFIADIHESFVFYDYVGLDITIKAFIHYDVQQAKPLLYYSGSYEGIQLNYDTDQEKMAALIEMGRDHFENRIYHPFETLDMPTYFGILDAYLTYQILSGEALIQDQIIQMVSQPETISLQITALIGTYEEIIIYTVHIEPYVFNHIEDLMLLNPGDLVVIQGTVRATDFDHMIVEDTTGMVYTDGFYGYNVGDVVIIRGYINHVNGMIMIQSYGDDALSATIGIDSSQPTLSTISINDTGALDPSNPQLVFYTTYQGVIINRDGILAITNGTYEITLIRRDPDVYTQLVAYEGQLVSIKVYYIGYEHYGEPILYAWYAGQPNEIEALQMTDQEIATEILSYAVHKLDQPYYSDDMTMYPMTHPHFQGSIQVINNGIHANLIDFNQGVVTVSMVEQVYVTEITVQIDYAGIVLSQVLNITITPYPITSIEDAYSFHEGEIVFLKVTIQSIQYHFDSMIYVTDASGSAYYIDMSNDLHPYVGYEVILKAMVNAPEQGVYYLDMVDVRRILNPTVLDTPLQVTLSHFLVNGELNTMLLGVPVIFTGLLMSYGSEYAMFEYSYQIVLVGNVLPAYQQLMTMQDQTIQVTGMLVGYRMDFMTMQMLPLIAYIPNPMS